MNLLGLLQVPLAEITSEYYLYGAAGVVSLFAFVGLIMTPALGAFSRPAEKVAAGFLSLFVLAALVLVGLAVGFAIFYNWDSIQSAL